MDKMKNSGMSETMQTLMRKSVCALLSLLLLGLLYFLFREKADEELLVALGLLLIL